MTDLEMRFENNPFFLNEYKLKLNLFLNTDDLNILKNGRQPKNKIRIKQFEPTAQHMHNNQHNITYSHT